jgi:hypothetical protein
MSAVTILTPRMEVIAKIAKEKLPDYLAERSLIAKRHTSRATLVAYDTDLERTINAVGTTVEAIVIRDLRSGENVKQLIKDKLTTGKVVVIEPSKRMFANYFTVQGFCDSMTAIGAELPEAEVLVPAGCYGSRLLFALRLGSTDRHVRAIDE